jgi:hypothetical protein
MVPALKKITYEELNARQKENYNFLKISAVLADYGSEQMRALLRPYKIDAI